MATGWFDTPEQKPQSGWWGSEEEDAVVAASPRVQDFDTQDFMSRGGWNKYNSIEDYKKELAEEQREKEINEAEEALRIEEFNSSPAAMTSNELVIDNGQITENTPSASATKKIELNEEQKDLVRVRDAVIRQMFVNSGLIRELDGTSNCEISFRNNEGRYALFLRPRDTNYMINATCGFGGEPVKDRIYFNLSKKQEGNYKIPTEFMSEYVVVDADTLTQIRDNKIEQLREELKEHEKLHEQLERQKKTVEGMKKGDINQHKLNILVEKIKNLNTNIQILRERIGYTDIDVNGDAIYHVYKENGKPSVLRNTFLDRTKKVYVHNGYRYINKLIGTYRGQLGILFEVIKRTTQFTKIQRIITTLENAVGRHIIRNDEENIKWGFIKTVFATLKTKQEHDEDLFKKWKFSRRIYKQSTPLNMEDLEFIPHAHHLFTTNNRFTDLLATRYANYDSNFTHLYTKSSRFYKEKIKGQPTLHEMRKKKLSALESKLAEETQLLNTHTRIKKSEKELE
jgi:hypothetical protein